MEEENIENVEKNNEESKCDCEGDCKCEEGKCECIEGECGPDCDCECHKK
ncbi:MAG: hypothetical protein AAB446_02885 [Patescibacteria group bacterium]